MPKIFYCVGVTCSGKDTFIERMKELCPDKVGLVQVGKEMRRRCPPEYFNGLGAMSKTEEEARKIFLEQMASSQDKEYILVSGQPRLVSQCDLVTMYPGFITVFHASDSELKRRVLSRSKTTGDYELSMQRLQNDKIQLYDVFVKLTQLYIAFVTPNYVAEVITGKPYDLVQR